MLDNLDLTHMNGRVYDPRVGRFISADPYIDGALNTQGWNRYAYVKNNPLSAFDPSGFGQEDAGGDCNSSSEAQISNPGDCSAGTTGGSAPSDTFEEVVVHSSRIGDGVGGSIETVTVSASRGGGLNPLPIDFSNPGSRGGSGSPGRGGMSAGDGTQTLQGEPLPPCDEGLIELGNELAMVSATAGDLSGKLIGGELVTAAAGAVVAQPEVLAIGLAITETGGALGIGAGVIQLGAGVLQGIGGGDYSNATNALATLSLGAGIKFSIGARPGAGYRTVSQRATDRLSRNSSTVTGGAYDSMTGLMDSLGPQQTSCHRR